MPIAIVVILLVVGSVIFHFVSPWTFTPLASNWSQIDDTINLTFWVTGFVFVAINLFMAYAHVAHDCIVGNDNVFANNAAIAGHVIVGNSVTIGGLSTIHQFCILGDHSFVGMNTSISMDVPAFVKVAADPARVIGLNSIGMARNEIPEESINLLKKSYKVVYKRGLKLEAAIKKLEIMHSERDDSFLLTFINSIKESSRGILR